MLEKSIMIAMMVMGLHIIISWQGMIFEFIPDWFARQKKDSKIQKIKKPVFDCSICMTPWWGTLFYWIFFGSSVREWILVVFTAMGINATIVWLIKRY